MTPQGRPRHLTTPIFIRVLRARPTSPLQSDSQREETLDGPRAQAVGRGHSDLRALCLGRRVEHPESGLLCPRFRFVGRYHVSDLEAKPGS